LGSMALTGRVDTQGQGRGDEMVIEEDAAHSVAVRKDLLDRASISGAIQALRKELSDDETLKSEIWECAKYCFPFVSRNVFNDVVHRIWILLQDSICWILRVFCTMRKHRIWWCSNCPRQENASFVIISAR